MEDTIEARARRFKEKRLLQEQQSLNQPSNSNNYNSNTTTKPPPGIPLPTSNGWNSSANTTTTSQRILSNSNTSNINSNSNSINNNQFNNSQNSNSNLNNNGSNNGSNNENGSTITLNDKVEGAPSEEEMARLVAEHQQKKKKEIEQQQRDRISAGAGGGVGGRITSGLPNRGNITQGRSQPAPPSAPAVNQWGAKGNPTSSSTSGIQVRGAASFVTPTQNQPTQLSPNQLLIRKQEIAKKEQQEKFEAERLRNMSGGTRVGINNPTTTTAFQSRPQQSQPQSVTQSSYSTSQTQSQTQNQSPQITAYKQALETNQIELKELTAIKNSEVARRREVESQLLESRREKQLLETELNEFRIKSQSMAVEDRNNAVRFNKETEELKFAYHQLREEGVREKKKLVDELTSLKMKVVAGETREKDLESQLQIALQANNTNRKASVLQVSPILNYFQRFVVLTF